MCGGIHHSRRDYNRSARVSLSLVPLLPPNIFLLFVFHSRFLLLSFFFLMGASHINYLKGKSHRFPAQLHSRGSLRCATKQRRLHAPWLLKKKKMGIGFLSFVSLFYFLGCLEKTNKIPKTEHFFVFLLSLFGSFWGWWWWSATSRECDVVYLGRFVISFEAATRKCPGQIYEWQR